METNQNIKRGCVKISKYIHKLYEQKVENDGGVPNDAKCGEKL